MVSELQPRLLFSASLGRDCKWHCLNIFQPHNKAEEVNVQLFLLHPGSLETTAKSCLDARKASG